MNKEKLLTPDEASQLLKDEHNLDVPADTLRLWCRQGKIKGKKLVGKWLIPESEVRKLLE